MIQFVLETDRGLFEDAFRYAQQQVRKIIETHPDFYPMYTSNGRWKHEGPVLDPLVRRIFPRHDVDFPQARSRGSGANGDNRPGRVLAGAGHALHPSRWSRASTIATSTIWAFIFMSTYYRWYQITHDPKLKEVIIEAGKTQAMRFKENGQYLRSFVGENSLFIDIMMNVGIIFYAARETGDRRLRDVALRHCLTTRRVLVRGDGSTAHEGIFDLETGEFLRQATQQGYRGDSCWSRGLAWSLYGFSISYEYSRDPAVSRDRRSLRRLLHHAFQPGWRSAVGFQRAAREPQAAGYVGRRDRRFRTAAAVPAAAGSGEGALLLVHRDHDPADAVRESTWRRRTRSGKGFSRAASIICTRNWAWMNR